MRGLILFCLLGSSVLAAGSDRVAELAKVHLQAIGGREKVAALAAYRASGHVFAREKKLRFTLFAARPDRIRVETEMGARTLVQASDGEDAPWEFDTGTWPPKYRPMVEANAKTFVADAEFDDPLVAGAARGFTFDYAGETEAEGRKFIRIMVTRKLTQTFSILLDPATYLITYRVEQRPAFSGRTLQIVTRYDDYRPVAGVLIPHHVALAIDGRVTQQTRIESIEPNPTITKQTFSRPKPAGAK